MQSGDKYWRFSSKRAGTCWCWFVSQINAGVSPSRQLSPRPPPSLFTFCPTGPRSLSRIHLMHLLLYSSVTHLTLFSSTVPASQPCSLALHTFLAPQFHCNWLFSCNATPYLSPSLSLSAFYALSFPLPLLVSLFTTNSRPYSTSPLLSTSPQIVCPRFPLLSSSLLIPSPLYPIFFSPFHLASSLLTSVPSSFSLLSHLLPLLLLSPPPPLLLSSLSLHISSCHLSSPLLSKTGMPVTSLLVNRIIMFTFTLANTRNCTERLSMVCSGGWWGIVETKRNKEGKKKRDRETKGQIDEKGTSKRVKEKDRDRESVRNIICRQRKRFCKTETIKSS